MTEKKSMENFKQLNIFQVSILAAIMAMFGNILVFSVSKIFGIVLEIPKKFGGTEMMPLHLNLVILATVVPAFMAGFLFWVMRKFSKEQAIRDFLVVGVGFFLFSLGGPFGLTVSLGVKLFLCTLHAVAAFFIITTFYNFNTVKKQK